VQWKIPGGGLGRRPQKPDNFLITIAMMYYSRVRSSHADSVGLLFRVRLYFENNSSYTTNEHAPISPGL